MCGECSGTVIAAGENRKQVRVGDRVCAFDATPFASHAKAALTNVHKIPDSMSLSKLLHYLWFLPLHTIA
jgi:NADPH:quinone reductase-like Zn-dependent oxidoreductase